MRASVRPSTVATLLTLSMACGDGRSDAAPEAETRADTTGAVPSTSGVVVEGFSGPESVLHDPRADVYLVSNLDGAPAQKDGSGFISVVSPDGEVRDLRWIDGASEGVELHAPKGMGLHGDTLFVTDIDVVRLFDRSSGAPIDEWEVSGATFLNDLAVAGDGTVYVTDSGWRFENGQRRDAGTSKLHVFDPEGSRRSLATGDITGLNGVAVADGRVYGVSASEGRIFMIEDGTLTELPELPGLRLDGIVVAEEGLMISDWDTEAVYLLRPNGSIGTLVRNVPSPADIGYDSGRGRLLIPGLTTDRVMLAPVDVN